MTISRCPASGDRAEAGRLTTGARPSGSRAGTSRTGGRELCQPGKCASNGCGTPILPSLQAT
jgi:hypothetical protein